MGAPSAGSPWVVWVIVPGVTEVAPAGGLVAVGMAGAVEVREAREVGASWAHDTVVGAKVTVACSQR